MALWKKLPKPDPAAEEKFRQQLEEEHIRLDWKDKLAMFLAAYAVLFIPAALILIAMAAIVLFLFGAM